jgi:gas vesicle protein
MRKALSFLEGLVVGAITGGSIAILLAPKSGPELQQDIQAYVDHLVEEGRNAAEARRQELEEQLDAFKQGRPLPPTPSES